MALPFILLGTALAAAAATTFTVFSGSEDQKASHKKSTKKNTKVDKHKSSSETHDENTSWSEQIQNLANKISDEAQKNHQPPAQQIKDANYWTQYNKEMGKKIQSTYQNSINEHSSVNKQSHNLENTTSNEAQVNKDTTWSEQIQNLANKISDEAQKNHQPPAQQIKDANYWTQYNKEMGKKIQSTYQNSINEHSSVNGQSHNLGNTTSNEPQKHQLPPNQIKDANYTANLNVMDTSNLTVKPYFLFAEEIAEDKKRTILLQEYLEYFIKAAGYTVEEFEIRFDLPSNAIFDIINKKQNLSILHYLAFGSFFIENSNLTSKCLVDASILGVLINCLVENEQNFSTDYKKTMSALLKALSNITESNNDNHQEEVQKIVTLIIRMHNYPSLN